MDRDDVRRLLDVSYYHSVCVSIENSIEFPGYVRSAYVRPDNQVSIEYEVYGMDEGGTYYWGQYSRLDEALDALVEFLGRPVDDWDELQLSAYYPERDSGADLKKGHAAMNEAVRGGKVPVPAGTQFVLKGCSYYTELESEG
jgi:hypothetical protein